MRSNTKRAHKRGDNKKSKSRRGHVGKGLLLGMGRFGRGTAKDAGKRKATKLGNARAGAHRRRGGGARKSRR